MSRLVRLYAGNLLKREVILAAGDKLKGLKLDSSSQVLDEHLGIDNDTRISIAALEEELDPKPFYLAVRSFYVATDTKMLNKFPFGDTLMKNLGILQTSKASSFPSSTVVNLAKRFPQLGLSDFESLQCLKEEFMDYILSPDDLPTPLTYNAVGHTEKECAGPYWWEVGNMKGETRFPNLYKLMAGLLCIPCSNLMLKVHTDQRASLNQ